MVQIHEEHTFRDNRNQDMDLSPTTVDEYIAYLVSEWDGESTMDFVEGFENPDKNVVDLNPLFKHLDDQDRLSELQRDRLKNYFGESEFERFQEKASEVEGLELRRTVFEDIVDEVASHYGDIPDVNRDFLTKGMVEGRHVVGEVDIEKAEAAASVTNVSLDIDDDDVGSLTPRELMESIDQIDRYSVDFSESRDLREVDRNNDFGEYGVKNSYVVVPKGKNYQPPNIPEHQKIEWDKKLTENGVLGVDAVKRNELHRFLEPYYDSENDEITDIPSFDKPIVLGKDYSGYSGYRILEKHLPGNRVYTDDVSDSVMDLLEKNQVISLDLESREGVELTEDQGFLERVTGEISDIFSSKDKTESLTGNLTELTVKNQFRARGQEFEAAFEQVYEDGSQEKRDTEEVEDRGSQTESDVTNSSKESKTDMNSKERGGGEVSIDPEENNVVTSVGFMDKIEDNFDFDVVNIGVIEAILDGRDIEEIDVLDIDDLEGDYGKLGEVEINGEMYGAKDIVQNGEVDIEDLSSITKDSALSEFTENVVENNGVAAVVDVDQVSEKVTGPLGIDEPEFVGDEDLDIESRFSKTYGLEFNRYEGIDIYRRDVSSIDKLYRRDVTKSGVDPYRDIVKDVEGEVLGRGKQVVVTERYRDEVLEDYGLEGLMDMDGVEVKEADMVSPEEVEGKYVVGEVSKDVEGAAESIIEDKRFSSNGRTLTRYSIDEKHRRIAGKKFLMDPRYTDIFKDELNPVEIDGGNKQEILRQVEDLDLENNEVGVIENPSDIPPEKMFDKDYEINYLGDVSVEKNQFNMDRISFVRDGGIDTYEIERTPLGIENDDLVLVGSYQDEDKTADLFRDMGADGVEIVNDVEEVDDKGNKAVFEKNVSGAEASRFDSVICSEGENLVKYRFDFIEKDSSRKSERESVENGSGYGDPGQKNEDLEQSQGSEISL